MSDSDSSGPVYKENAHFDEEIIFKNSILGGGGISIRLPARKLLYNHKAPILFVQTSTRMF